MDKRSKASGRVLCGAVLLALALVSFAQAQPPRDRLSHPLARKPRVLILGDSISIGYTPYVQKQLEREAVVLRPMRKGKDPENCEGTTAGIKRLDDWLSIGGGRWDVIHFNFGLHDLKRVDPKTGDPSPRPGDPRQAEPKRYERQLRAIVARLKKTGAKLIFATTTPVPPGVNPHRDPHDVSRYNQIALRIMEENGVAIDDLYAFVLPRLKDIQLPVNVHFSDEGSKRLADEVVRHIHAALVDRAIPPPYAKP
jgi:lysophospholipase L1-like esterase